MASSTRVFYQCLASMLAIKWGNPYGPTMSWLNCRLVFPYWGLQSAAFVVPVHPLDTQSEILLSPSSPLKLSSLWSTVINFLFLNPLIKQILLYRLFFLLFCLLPPLSKKISPLFSCFPTCTRCLFVILWEDFRHFPTRKKFCYHPISSVDHPHTDHYFRLLCTVGSGLLSAMRLAIKFHGGADDANFPTRKKILLPSSAVWVAAALAINTS